MELVWCWYGSPVIITWSEEDFDRFATSAFASRKCPYEERSFCILNFPSKKRSRMSCVKHIYSATNPVLVVRADPEAFLVPTVRPDKEIFSVGRSVPGVTHVIRTAKDLEDALHLYGLASLIAQEPSANVLPTLCSQVGCLNTVDTQHFCSTCNGCFCGAACFTAHECCG